MLSVRLAKEAHFTQAAEDRKVPGLRSTIRLAEPTTRSARPAVPYYPRASARATLQDQDYLNGLRQGLLTGSQAGASQLHWIARLLGCVCTAFLAACANAWLVGIMSRARLSFPACPSLAGPPNAGASLSSQVVQAIKPWTLRPAHPRAPPILVAASSVQSGGQCPLIVVITSLEFCTF